MRHHSSPFCIFALVLGVLAWALPGAAPAAEDGNVPRLRYAWKAGQTYAYAVTVEGDYGDYLDVLSGTPTYTVLKTGPDGTQLSFRGGLSEKQQAKPGKRILFGPGRMTPFSPFTGVGAGARASELTANDRGEIISAQGTSQLPYLLGNLSQLVLVPLPKEAERTWKIAREANIALAEGRLPRLMMRDDRKVLKATDETTYTIEEATDKAVSIRKRVALATTETVDGKPRFEVTGDGTVVFDLKAGLPAKLDLQEKVFVRDAKGTDETPLKVVARLLDEAERAKLATSAEGAALFPNEPLTEALQKQAAADLKSGDKGRTLRAMALLQQKQPEKPNKEIAEALEALLADKEQVNRFSASAALKNWAVAETVPALVKALDDDNVSVRHNAMDALGRLKAEGGAEALARKLASTTDRYKAAQALQAMGPAAEAAVLPHAEDKEWMTRSEVCKILKAIGTEKSVPALKALQDDAQPLVKRQAKEALDAIAARK
jgi:hypothetical protein